jgi:transposase
MSLAQSLSSYWSKIQGELFPFLADALGPLTSAHKLLVVVLDMVRIEVLVRHWSGLPGRPKAERAALGRAFIAKAVFNLPTTRMLIDRLNADPALRRLCGWSRLGQVPHESTFSRAFAEFAKSELAQRLHEALIAQMHSDRLVGHIARDATAIHGREKPVRNKETDATLPKATRKRGRPRKGEEPPPKQPRRIARQAAGMSMSAMLDHGDSASNYPPFEAQACQGAHRDR